MTQTKVLKLDPKAIDQGIIREAACVLEQGGLVAFPTETVYGIAVNLLNSASVERLKKIKDRPKDKQFSIHLADKADVDKYAVSVSPRAYKIIDHFWPGPLTIILQAPQGKSVGLRMPDNDIALRLLSSVDFPVIAPSANRAGQPAPKEADSVLKDLNGLIDLVLDGGPTQLGVESTILDARVQPFSILREGALKSDEVLKVALQKTILFVCTGNSCRSIMAEYLLKKKLSDSHRQDIEVISAGTFALFGIGPTRETQKLIEEFGMDASAHRAKKVSLELLQKTDLILVMEQRHKEELIRHFPQVKDRIHLLGEFVKLNDLELEISDPIGKSEEFYKMVFLKIKEAVDRLGDLI